MSQFELQMPLMSLSGMMQRTLVPGHENEKRSGNNLMALTRDQITIFHRGMSELFPPETVASDDVIIFLSGKSIYSNKIFFLPL